MKWHGPIGLSTKRQQMIACLTDPDWRKDSMTWPYLDRREVNDASYLLLPWNDEACRLLSNCNMAEAVEVAPMMYDMVPMVEGRFMPLKHQALTAAFITLHPRCYVLSEPRMGKTGSVIMAVDYLQRHRRITGAALVITTYTTMQSVWVRSITETLPGAEVVTVHGKGRAKALENVPSFFVTNYDSVRLEEKAFLEAIEDGRIGAIFIDELTHVGNSEAKRSKAITKLCRHPKIKWVCGLTGSPADNPDAVFGMAKCVNPGRLPVTTKKGWDNKIYNYWGMQAWQKTMNQDAPEVIRRTLMPAIRFKKADALDLPPVTEQVRTCDLTAEQTKAIKDLEYEAYTLLGSGEAITAANGGVLLQRVLQIALGCVKLEDGSTHTLDHQPRTDVIMDAIAETPNKVVVFSPYIGGCHMLAEECAKKGYSVDVITGAVSGKRRAEILHAFQYEHDPHILVCHPITVGFGTELSAADTMIFAVPLLLGGFVYNQALERLSSVKQKSKNINIIHVLSCQAERKVLNHLQQGYNMGKTVASLFEDDRPRFV